MNDNFIQAQYDITKKSRLRQFYEKNKIVIFSSIFIIIIFFVSFSFYFENKKNKKILLSENYVQAKIYLGEGENIKALNVLKEVIYANDSTYSTLSLFLILNHNLMTEHSELLLLFDHLLEKNKFDKEIENLIIFKKALIDSNLVSESTLLDTIKPLLNKESMWKPHALLLLGDYFMSKNEYIKAIEFYQKIFSINNLQKGIYDRARSQLALISNE
tara:strand:+ start:44 stop:691 length:648 start_codon:yes stop_codon:yes gene_type:complete